MGKRVSIRDIAIKCSVSVGTVSRALSDDVLINEETRTRIKQIASEMGYVPNLMARSLSKKTNKIIGLIIPDITNPFFAEVAKSIEDYAREKEFSVFLCNTNLSLENEKKYIEQLYGYRVSGIIVVPVSLELDHITRRFSLLHNIVFLAYIPQSLENSNYVITEDYKIISISLNYLLTIGHKKISYIGGEENLSSNIARRNTYLDLMKENNLEPILIGEGGGNYLNSDQIVEDIKNDLLNTQELPTAIITYNDNLALHTIQAIEEIGLMVPEDISVVGIDNIAIANLYNIQLTTVSQPRNEMGRKCAELLINKISGKAEEYQQLVLEPELVIRRTTKPIF